MRVPIKAKFCICLKNLVFLELHMYDYFISPSVDIIQSFSNSRAHPSSRAQCNAGGGIYDPGEQMYIYNFL